MEDEKKIPLFARIIAHKRILFVVLIAMFVIASGAGFYYFFYQKKISNFNFFQELSKYEDSRESFQNAWPSIISSARTSVHYLMILKRLDQYQLEAEYSKTLIQALTKFPKVDSFYVLAVDAYLNLGNGDVFMKYLKTKIDLIWDKYPNSARLYYVDAYDKNKKMYDGDELLNIYYDVVEKRFDNKILESLWQLTQEPAFLYLASLSSLIEGRREESYYLYKQLPIDWRLVYVEKYDFLAWLIKDKEYLEPLVRSRKIVDEYLRLSTIYIFDRQYTEAESLINELLEFYPKILISNVDLLEQKIWLSIVTDKINLESYYEDMLNNQYLEVVSQYLVYLYSYNKRLFDRFVIEYPNMNELVKLPLVKFVFLFNKSAEMEEMHAFLWNTLNTTEIDQEKTNVSQLFWIKVATSFFLEERQFLDMKQLYEDYMVKYDDLRQSFYLYYNLAYSPEKLTDEDMNRISAQNNRKNFDWWHYYNLAVWGINNGLYEHAQYFLGLVYNHVDFDSITKQSYYQYYLIQQIRMDILEGNREAGEEKFNELSILYPTQPYRAELESKLNFFESLGIKKE